MGLSLHTELCDRLGIEYPVMAFTHTRDVVAAVSNGGGSGCLGCIRMSPEEITSQINWLKQHTDKPFGIDLVFPKASPEMATREQLLSMVPKGYRDFMDRVKESLELPEEIQETWGGMALGIGGTHEFQSKQLDAALKAKPAFIACGLGITRDVVEQCHAAGIQVFSLVGNVKNARRNAELGVDFIIAQGTEAGGHTGRIGTLALVPQVVDAVKPIPVLAAGGIADGRGLVAALALGAVGVWTGTIWLACHETPLADYIKDRLIESTDEDFVITKIYTGKTARFLKNKYIERWQQPDAPQPLPMPLQNLYSPMPLGLSTENPSLLSLFSKCEVADWVSTPAGNASPLIKQRRSARQTLYDMVSEAIDILGTE